MEKYQMDEEEVQEFLDKTRMLISKGNNVQINNKPWSGNRVNKTLAYMAETGITKKI